ncbi:hypothetical protein PRIPAC_87867 [Pristionchus pacificus]|uniref:G protein-coupled receptor n=1 Tax=Pristionchus pacificus TaxID=54126 RepID=A0A2A6B8X8_PRIPA|nr:hypothetical protein PRIPAC_87867 [Pristionchus pacificus]|eukprot:PDM62325.1 G protein-coupled receptor [Pristionchus pacificus]
METALDRLNQALPVIHGIMFLMGFSNNTALLIAAFMRAPPALRSYSVMIKVGALNDFISVICDTFAMQRLWILDNASPRRQNVLYVMLALYSLPAFVVFLFSFAQAEDSFVREFISLHEPYYLSEPGVLTGHYGFTPLVMFVIAFCAVTPGISYVIITVTRNKVNELSGVKEPDTGLAPPALWDIAADKQAMQQEQRLQVARCTKIIIAEGQDHR